MLRDGENAAVGRLHLLSYRVKVPDLQGFVIRRRHQKVGVRGPGHIRYTLHICHGPLGRCRRYKELKKKRKHSTVIISHTYKFVARYSFLKLAIICPPDFDQFISSYKQEGGDCK